MNLSKLLVSVNIAATLPLAVQIGAQASNQNPTEANSLKDTVKALSVQTPAQAKGRSTQVSVAKKSFNLPKSNPNSLEVDGVKLRAFMPGRRLPSSSDSQLVSQQAQMAPEQQSSLSGNVSESYARSTGSAYNYAGAAPSSAYLSTAPRVVLNQMQTVARQLKAAANKHGAPIRPTSIAPITASNSQSTAGDFGQYSKDIPASWMANEKNLSLIEAPTASPQEMVQIEHIIDQQRPAQANTGTAGPAPFPLNLLPQQSLKQVLGASAVPSRPQSRAPQAAFGSWHQGMQSRMVTGLAPAGFHSNLHGGHFGSYIAPHASHKFTAFRPSNNNNKMLIAQAPRTATPGMKIASYAPYNTTKAY